MTKRDFFRIIIKLFGLYSLILVIFTYFPSSISYIAFDTEPFIILFAAGVILFVVLVYVFLILRTDKIINLLKLDKGFDDDMIELGNFNATKIFKFALIFIGGFLIIDNFPDFLYYCYLAFKNEVSPNGLNFIEENSFGSKYDYFNWAISGMNVLIGYLFLTNYDRIAKWLTRKDKTVNL